MALDRRGFFKTLTKLLVVGWGVALIYPISKYLKRPETGENQAKDVVVCKVGDLKPGESKTFKFGPHPGLLICDAKGDYHAVDATCTHLGCTTQYRKDKNDIFCACHSGVYGLDGKNVSGPPPRPLTGLKVTVTGQDIVVSKA